MGFLDEKEVRRCNLGNEKLAVPLACRDADWLDMCSYDVHRFLLRNGCIVRPTPGLF